MVTINETITPKNIVVVINFVLMSKNGVHGFHCHPHNPSLIIIIIIHITSMYYGDGWMFVHCLGVVVKLGVVDI
jgi:hypothetical protein